MWSATKKAIKDSEDSVKAANRSATAAEDSLKKMGEVSEKQSGEMRASIAEAARSASAMEDTLNHSRQISKQELRGYIGLDLEPELPTLRMTPGYIESTFKLKNFGKTPIFITQAFCQIDIQQYEPDLRTYQFQNSANIAAKVLNPGQITTLGQRNHTNISSALQGQISNNTFKIYFWGKIEFIDAFGDSRWITFCFRTNDTSNSHARFLIANNGNESSDYRAPTPPIDTPPLN